MIFIGFCPKKHVETSLKSMQNLLEQVEQQYAPEGWTPVWCDELLRHYFVNNATG